MRVDRESRTYYRTSDLRFDRVSQITRAEVGSRHTLELTRELALAY